MTERIRQPISVPRRRQAESVSVQNLVKANRSPGTTEGNAAQTVPKPTSAVQEPLLDSAPKQVTFYMASDDVKRAKAAYTGTSGQEMDRSWSEFISRAVLMEVERRERLYNEGQQFQGGSRNLAPGRKIQI
ncbi:ParB family protein [Pseudarthrobacter sp. H2]|uniref:ParB family protein n=1 Tax=Pseudarthrobacter sp. H2 TaxID=3418415 RepID=UPI003CF6F10C